MRHGEISILVSPRKQHGHRLVYGPECCNIAQFYLGEREFPTRTPCSDQSTVNTLFLEFFCLWVRGFFLHRSIQLGTYLWSVLLSWAGTRGRAGALWRCSSPGSGWHLHKPHSGERGWMLLWGSVGQVLILDIKVRIFVQICTDLYRFVLEEF